MAPRAKVEIVYPPLTLRKWRTPLLGRPHVATPFKRKVFLRKPIYPRKTVAGPYSKVGQIWHKYKKLTEHIFILRGSCNQHSHKYRVANRSRQCGCSCIACIGVLQCCTPDQWNSHTLDKILDIGDRIFTESCKNNANKQCNSVYEIFTSFYLGYLFINLGFAPEIKGKIFVDKTNSASLLDVLQEFFLGHTYALLEIEGRIITIFKNRGGYWFFDPFGRDALGDISKPPPPHGERCLNQFPLNFITCMRYVSLKNMTLNIIAQRDDKEENQGYTIYPVYIKRKELRRFDPPNTLDDFSAKRRYDNLKKEISWATLSPRKEPSVKNLQFTPAESTTEVPVDPEELRKPLERPKEPSFTYFYEIIPKKFGIMRAKHHQNDPTFSRYAGKQGLANGIAAIAMLREHKSRFWIKMMLDEILITGEQIYLDSRKNMENPGDELGIKELTKCIKINQNMYTPFVDEITVIGKLTSMKYELMNLQQGLEEFFTENSAGLIRGPNIVAIWREQERFYMFDPNERNKEGKFILKLIKIGEENNSAEQQEEGVACLTWFSVLEEVTKLYLENVPRDNRNDPFVISRVEIKNFAEKPDAWNNFVSVEYGKWILRGMMAQDDKIFPNKSRDTQAVAISVMAIAYSKIKKVETWNREMIDEILQSGDNYYNESVTVLQNKGTFIKAELLVTEVLKMFVVLGEDLVLYIDDCLINGVLNAPDDDPVPNLKIGLEMFFKISNCCVITSRGIAVAVWFEDGFYYCFDSHARDDKGFKSLIGVACTTRYLNIEDLVKILLSNFNPDLEDKYNISRIDVFIWDNVDGIKRPALNNYIELSPTSAILRSSLYEGNKEKYDIFADKQTVANLLVALGMPYVLETTLWDEATVDEILRIGQALYEKSLEEVIRKEKEVPIDRMEPEGGAPEGASPEGEGMEGEFDDPKKAHEITLENVIKEFYIGLNKINIILDGPKIGVFEQDPQLKRLSIDERVANSAGTLKLVLTEFLDDSGDDIKMAIIKSDSLTVAVWREEGVFYLFDPKGRDHLGMAIGRELWSAKVYPPEPMGEESGGAEFDEDNMYDIEKGGGDTAVSNPTKPASPSQMKTPLPQIPSQGEHAVMEAGMMGEEEEVDDEYSIPTISSLDFSNAKGCTMQFVTIDSLYEHIIENIPPNKRCIDFNFVPVTVVNTPELKVKTDYIERSIGDWNEFVEIDTTQWILRGTINMANSMYPICNRGNQYSTMCISSLAFAKLFDLSKFKPLTVDDILKYGDRIHTVIMKARVKEIKKLDLGLSDAEKCLVLNQQRIGTGDIMENFLIGDWKMFFEVTQKVIEGDIIVTNEEKEEEEKVEKVEEEEVVEEELLGVPKALDKFFETHTLGVFTCKNVSTGIFKIDDIYYQFDPASRGPSGFVEENGTACITRHLNLDTLVVMILRNLPKEGSNLFFIDSVEFTPERYIRPQPPLEKIISINPKITAFNEIDPGKLILSGNCNMNNPKFGKSPNSTCCANALVALGMSILYKPCLWTTPIVDDVLTQANILYEVTKEELSDSFNPFEDHMDLVLINKEFDIGLKHVQCELDEEIQKGILNIKHPKIYNLRRGLEAFFEKFTHGVIFSDCQTTAVWKDTELFFLFDPYPRSRTGHVQNGGNACLMVFKNITTLSNHFLYNVPEKQKDSEYTIYPVTLKITDVNPKKPKMLLKCQILTCKDIPSFLESEENDNVPPEVPKRKEIKPRCPVDMYEKPKRESDAYFATPLSTIEQKKEWARNESVQRSKKEMDKLCKLMREEFYPFPNGTISILRCNYSQSNKKYSKISRNHQQIPNSLVAIVMFKLHPPNTWTYKNLEIILDSGDTLYKDSWWFYKPKNPDLGLKNVLRTFYIQCAKFTTFIYKPAILGDMVYRALYVGLLNFFLHETSGIVVTSTISVAVFQKAGYYYIFDPYDRDKEGRPVRCGTACVLRFLSVEDLAKKLLENAECLREDDGPRGKYSIHAVCMSQSKPESTVIPEKSISSYTCRTDEIV